MQIIQQPSLYNFTGNLPDIIVLSSAPVEFRFGFNDVVVLKERYSPCQGRVTIPLRHFAETFVQSADPSALPITSTPFIEYYYTLDEQRTPLYILPGGVNVSTFDAELFCKTNFLSWQPQTRHTTMNAPGWLRYAALVSGRLQVTGRFADGTSLTQTHSHFTAGATYAFNVSYGYLCTLFDEQPAYMDLCALDAEGIPMTYTQRYVLAEDAEPNADYFVFENSLGGYDTVRFTGESKEISESTSRTALRGQTTYEYGVDFKRSYQKATGYLPDNATRLWVLDFFNSTKRHVVQDGMLKLIVVNKPKLEHIRGELSGFEFTYALARQTKYLNLPRTEVPETIEIADPSNELFFLKPRLESFPRASLSSECFIPVQQAYGDQWSTLAVSDLLAYFTGQYAARDHKHVIDDVAGLRQALENGGSAGAGGKPAAHSSTHALGGSDVITPRMIKASPEDHNHDQTYHPLGGRLNRDFEADDITTRGTITSRTNITARGSISATENLTFGSTLSTADFLAGLLGYGLRTDQKGNIEAQSLKLRTFLETPELIKNQIRVIGTQAWLTESGVVCQVIANPTVATGMTTQDGKRIVNNLTGKYLIRIRDDQQYFVPDDILRGIYNYDTGFQTVFLRVIRPLSGGYLVAPMNSQAPMTEMVLARQGNKTNTERQGAIYLDSAKGYLRVLGGMNSMEIGLENLVAQVGDLASVVDADFPDMPKAGIYVKGIAAKGDFILRNGKSVSGSLGDIGTEIKALSDQISLMVTGADLKRTGIDIQAGTITLNGDTKIYDSDGKLVALFTGGKIKAEYIDADNLVARQIDTRDNGQGAGVQIRPRTDAITITYANGTSMYIGGGSNPQIEMLGTPGEYGLYSNDEISFGYGQAVYSKTGITLPPTATMDMPCVALCGYGVHSGGTILNRFGAKIHQTASASKPANTSGIYVIPHNIGHTDFTVCVNLKPADVNWFGAWKEVASERTTTSCTIRIADLRSSLQNIAFDITFFGKN